MADARRHAGGEPGAIGLADFLRDAALELDDIYKSSGWTWSRLRREAGLPAPSEGPDEARVARAISRLLHVDDPNRLALYKRAVAGDLSDVDLDPSSSSGRALMGLHFSIWGIDPAITSLRDSIDRLRQHPALAMELSALFDILDDQADHVPEPLDDQMRWPHRIPLAVHSRASLDEIMAAFGRMTFDRPNRLRQGVDYDRGTSSDLFFWESQSTTSVQSPTGQRYLQHQAKGTHVFLFVRHRKNEAGRTAAYTCLGAGDYVSHERSRPIAITWRLRKPMPDDFFREARVAAG
jgi:hypothetical protein